MKIPSELVPRCPVCGAPVTTNLRADDKFVEDDGWHAAADNYEKFLKSCEGKKDFAFGTRRGYEYPGYNQISFMEGGCFARKFPLCVSGSAPRARAF